MSSRNFAVHKRNNQNFREKKNLKDSGDEKKKSHSSGGFFIKSANKNKKNIASDISNKKNKAVASQNESFRKKEKQPRPSQDGDESKSETHPFDKKAWRFKRYSKKYKLDQWKDVRKTHILRGLDKTVNQSSTNLNLGNYRDPAEVTPENETNSEKKESLLDDDDGIVYETEKTSTKSKQNSLFNRNKLVNKRNPVSEEVDNKKMERLKRRAAKEEAIKEHKRKKLEKFKKLSRKTKKGQPVMKDRMEVLLEEIQNSLGH